MNIIYKKTARLLKRLWFVFPLFSLAMLLLMLPVPTFAFWDKIVAAVTALPVLIISFALIFFIIVTGFFVNLMTAILGWVISPDFVRFSYTRPCAILNPAPDCNPIISIGLQTTQQFVNMLLVVMLVFIAISIALRLQEGNAQKMFYRLILIALLVNFAPVLVGLVVDAANILMYYFLTPLQGGITQLGNQLAVYWDTFVKSLSRVWTDLPSQAGLLGQAMTILFMNTMVGFVLFMFIGIFTVRYIAIWIIVILSPLAFVFYIWPSTEGLAKAWWKQLLQWSFVGIPIAFFMFLGISSFSALSANFNAAQIKASAATDPLTVRLMSDLFPYFIVIIFLMCGLFIGLSSSAMGAKAVLSGTRKLGEWAGKKGWDKTKRFGSDIGGAAKDAKDKVSFYRQQYQNARSGGMGWGAATGQAARQTWQKKTSVGIKSEGVASSDQAKQRILDLTAGAISQDDAEKKVKLDIMNTKTANDKVNKLVKSGMGIFEAEAKVEKEMMKSREAKLRIRDLTADAMSTDEAKKTVGKWAIREGLKQDRVERTNKILEVAGGHTKAAGKGAGGAMIDMTQATWYKVFGDKPKKKKKKKKGSRKCPNPDCPSHGFVPPRKISKSASHCPYCGEDLEEFESETST